MSTLRSLVAVTAILLAPFASAELREKTDYKRVAQQPTQTAGKIEVVEFFSYGCPHCFHAAKPVEKWVTQLPKNTTFVRVPLSLGYREWGVLSRTFYALQALGEFERLDAKLFEAIHTERQRLFDEEALTLWMSKQGVAADKFREAYNSQAVSSKVMQAEQMSRNYAVASVPTFAVAGRYVVLAENARTIEDVLAIAREVVDKASKEPAAK
jgi:protein dithiol oxidoreductase (disulfide-forming)